MLVENDAQVRAAQQLGQQPLALLDLLTPHILAVELEQIERAERG